MLVRELTAGGMDLLAFDPESDEPPRPLLSGAYDEISPSVSPDGRWMVYLSDETGADEIYVASYPVPDQRVQVSNNGGTEPLWAPDGSELFYWQGNTLMAVTLETEPQLRAARREALFEGSYARYRWHPQYDLHPDGDRFLMIDASGNEARIRVVLDWFSELRRLAPGGR